MLLPLAPLPLGARVGVGGRALHTWTSGSSSHLYYLWCSELSLLAKAMQTAKKVRRKPHFDRSWGLPGGRCVELWLLWLEPGQDGVNLAEDRISSPCPHPHLCSVLVSPHSSSHHFCSLLVAFAAASTHHTELRVADLCPSPLPGPERWVFFLNGCIASSSHDCAIAQHRVCLQLGTLVKCGSLFPRLALWSTAWGFAPICPHKADGLVLGSVSMLQPAAQW